jgi:hypothetical protein
VIASGAHFRRIGALDSLGCAGACSRLSRACRALTSGSDFPDARDAAWQLNDNEQIGLIGASVVDTENSFDVVLLADMTRGGDIGLRIRRELQALSGHGYRCGLRNLLPGSTGVIGPDIDRCIREGLALPLAPGQTVEARLAIGYSPGSLDAAVDISGVTAERIVLVIDTPPSPQQMGHWFAFGVGPVTWAPTNRWVRARLEELGFQVPVTEEDWRAIATPCRARAARAPLRFRPVAGRVGTSKASHWAKTAAEIDATYPTGGTFDIWMHGGPPAALEKDCTGAAEWSIFGPADMSVERFIEALDVFAYFPGATSADLPEASITAAMASGKPVVLPHCYRPQFGDAALYADPTEALQAAADLLGDEAALGRLRDTAAEHCRLSNSEAAYLARIEALIGAPDGQRPRPAPPSRRAPRMAPGVPFRPVERRGVGPHDAASGHRAASGSRAGAGLRKRRTLRAASMTLRLPRRVHRRPRGHRCGVRHWDRWFPTNCPRSSTATIPPSSSSTATIRPTV